MQLKSDLVAYHICSNNIIKTGGTMQSFDFRPTETSALALGATQMLSAEQIQFAKVLGVELARKWKEECHDSNGSSETRKLRECCLPPATTKHEEENVDGWTA
jgi:hypothetical protein